MKTQNTIVEVFEDNAGGIHCLHDNKMYFLGFDPSPGKLVADIVSASDWIEECEVEDDETKEAIAYAPPSEAKLIAEYYDGKIEIYVDDLGNAGKQYAGIED